MSDAKEKIYAVLHMIPEGHVLSYGEVASLAGLPGAARFIGTLLSRLPENTSLPWQRIIKANGQIAFPPGTPRFDEQVKRLQKEGIDVINGRIKMSRYGWRP